VVYSPPGYHVWVPFQIIFVVVVLFVVKIRYFIFLILMVFKPKREIIPLNVKIISINPLTLNSFCYLWGVEN